MALYLRRQRRKTCVVAKTKSKSRYSSEERGALVRLVASDIGGDRNYGRTRCRSGPELASMSASRRASYRGAKLDQSNRAISAWRSCEIV